MLAADGGNGQPRVAAVLRRRAVGLQRLRVVLAFGLFVGLGAVSLWPLVPTQSLGLVLEAGQRLGAVLGWLEIRGELLRLGAAAAGGRI